MTPPESELVLNFSFIFFSVAYIENIKLLEQSSGPTGITLQLHISGTLSFSSRPVDQLASLSGSIEEQAERHDHETQNHNFPGVTRCVLSVADRGEDTKRGKQRDLIVSPIGRRLLWSRQ